MKYNFVHDHMYALYVAISIDAKDKMALIDMIVEIFMHD
jgi:hypothetical protein